MLVFGDSGRGDSIESSMKLSLNSSGFRLVFGILAAITGFLKLLLPVEKQVPILGDLVPALAGMAAGFIIIFGFYRENSSNLEHEGQLDRLGDTFLRYKKAAGIVLLVVAALHFLFPKALFL